VTLPIEEATPEVYYLGRQPVSDIDTIAMLSDVLPACSAEAVASVMSMRVCDNAWRAPEIKTRVEDTYRQHRCGRLDAHDLMDCKCRYCGKMRGMQG
jgi:hypothetical protein